MSKVYDTYILNSFQSRQLNNVRLRLNDISVEMKDLLRGQSIGWEYSIKCRKTLIKIEKWK